MKRIIPIIALFALIFTACGNKNQDLALIKQLNGTVFKKDVSSESWDRVKAGDKLPMKTVIKASGNSTCDMQLSGDVSIRMKERTILYLKDLYNDKKADKQKTEMTVARGKVLVKVNKLLKNNSSMRFETPSTVAGVRGTEFIIDVDRDKNTRISVRSGKVSVAPKVKLSKTEKAQVSKQLMSSLSTEIILSPSEQVEVKKETVDSLKEKVVELAERGADDAQSAAQVSSIIRADIQSKAVSAEAATELKEFEDVEVDQEIETRLSSLVIESEPRGAMVFIDGKQAGSAPFARTLSSGDVVTLRVEKQGYLPHEQQIKVGDSDETVNVTLKPSGKGTIVEQGMLIVETAPQGAEVMLNGKFIGETPLTENVDVGQMVSLQVKKEGYTPMNKSFRMEGSEKLIKGSLTRIKKKPAPVKDEPVKPEAAAGPAAKSGQIVWEAASGLQLKSDLAGYNGSVYVTGRDGTVKCLDQDSKVSWSFKVKSGSQSSPVAHKDLLFVCGNDGMLYALNRKNGTSIWQKQIGTAVYAKPHLSGGTLYIGTSQGDMYAIAPSSGKVLWKYSVGSGIYTTALKAGSLIVFGCEDSHLYALDSTGALKWKFKTTKRILKASPAAAGSLVCIGSSDGILYAVSAADGKLKWKFATAGKILSTPAVGSGKVYLSSTDGKLYCLSSAGKKLWEKKLGTKLENSPVLSGGKVYIGSDTGKIYTLNAADGAQMAAVTIKSAAAGQLYVSGDSVYASTVSGQVVRIAR